MAIKEAAKQEETKSPSELVKECQKKLTTAGKYYEKEFIPRADRMVHLYELEHYHTEPNKRQEKVQRDRIKVPYPYANVRQILAETFSGLPDVMVKVEKKQDFAAQGQQEQQIQQQTGDQTPQEPQKNQIDGAETLRQAIEYVKRRSNLEREVKMTLIDGLTTGIGCTGIVAQANSKIPKFVRHLYREVHADWPHITDIYESDWIACKLVRPLSEIKEDESYDAVARQLVRAAKLDPTIYGEGGEIGTDYGVLWCWHDKRQDQYLVFADDQDLLLVNKTLSEMYDFKVVSDDFKVDWPFAFFIDEEMILKPWGLGSIYPIESQVRELDKTRTQQVNHRKRFNRKYGYVKGTLDAQGINQMKNPEDGTMVEFQKAITPANFQVIQDAPMPADVYRNDQTIQNDIQLISPLGSNFLAHGVGSKPNTLGEAQIQEQSSNTRLADKQKQIGSYIQRLYKMTAQYVQQYWKDEDDFLVSGTGSKNSDWLHFSPELAQGEYDYNIVPESMRDNTALYRQQVQGAMSTVIPMLRLANVSPAVAIMLRKYLETFETFKSVVDDIIPPSLMEEPVGGNMIIPTERITMTADLHDFPIPVQMKGLALAGIQTTEQDFTQAPTGEAQIPGLDPQLQQLLQSDPQAFLDAIKKLPQTEQQVIMQHIEQVAGGQSQAGAGQRPQSPISPSPAPKVPGGQPQSVPTPSTITTAANQVQH